MLFTPAYVRLAGLQAAREASLCVPHFTAQALGLYMGAAMPDFTRVLGIRTQVFTLM